MNVNSAEFNNDSRQNGNCESVSPSDIMDVAVTLNTPKWYYKGEDCEIHGPYSSSEMLRWHKAGYFTDSMPLRTEFEDRFHTLAEWIQYANGQSPFLILVNSFEQLINLSMSVHHHLSPLYITPTFIPSPGGAFIVLPSSTPNVNSIAHHTNINAAAAAAASMHGPSNFITHPYSPNQMILHQTALSSKYQHLQSQSQPPSEPFDEIQSTTSNTPDDTECQSWADNSSNRNITGLMDKCVGTDEAPWCDKRDKSNDPINFAWRRDVAVQTSAHKMRLCDVKRLLSELFNEPIEIDID